MRPPAPAIRQAHGVVADLVHDVVREIAALPAPVMRDLAPVLHQAERELAAGLGAWLKKADGAARFTTQEHRRALVQIRAARFWFFG